jgi:hypothetical protein
MSDDPTPVSQKDASEEEPAEATSSFQELADSDQQPGIVREFIEFLGESKSWWLTPIIVVLLLVGVLIVLSSTVVAPFIYPIF